jgi:hypothetical protein
MTDANPVPTCDFSRFPPATAPPFQLFQQETKKGSVCVLFVSTRGFDAYGAHIVL